MWPGEPVLVSHEGPQVTDRGRSAISATTRIAALNLA